MQQHSVDLPRAMPAMAACRQLPAASPSLLLSLALVLASLSSQCRASGQTTLGDPLMREALNAGKGQSGQAAVRFGGVPVFWSSNEHGGFAADARQDLPASARGAVVFVGQGGSACRVGAICSFEMLVRRPARWPEGAPHRRRDLMAVLTGPSLALATVEEMTPMDGSRFRFTFQVWDAGEYKVTVKNSCGMLQWRRGVSASGTQQDGLASWVLNVTKTDEDERQGSDALPCESSSVQGRWLLVQGEYRWVQYPCARTVPMDDWIPELNRAGIREITFIGDSHNRQIAHHLYYLTSGKRLNPHEAKSHASRTLTINQKSGASLVLSVNFIKGIYVSSEEFHCSMNHRSSAKPEWPNISRTADVYMLDAGSWTGMYCKEPEMAFVAHFAGFLEWATASIRARAKESLPLLLYRTAPPRPLGSRCIPITNVYVNFVNKLAREVAASQNFLTFDAHEVEGPRYGDHCGGGHFSCDGKEGRVIGDVGVGDVTAFVHFLLRYYQR